MPIKFACPACKNVMTVDSKFAGKVGKCNKCAGPVTVPSSASTSASAMDTSGSASANGGSTASQSKAEARAAQIAALNAAPPPSAGKLVSSGSLGSVFDELTESDYSRQSPYQNVYAPPKPKAANHAALNKAISEEGGGAKSAKKQKKVGADGKPTLTWTLIIYGVTDVISALGMYGLAIALAAMGIAILDFSKDHLPIVALGFSAIVICLGLFATLVMASGVGLLAKQVWGYATAVFLASFSLGVALLAFLVNIMDPKELLFPGLAILGIGSHTTYFFRQDCKSVFGLTSSKLAAIVGGAGLGIAVVLIGVLLLLGVFSDPSVPTENL